MIIECAQNADYLSNTYLVCDVPGGTGIVIDAGGPLSPLFAAATELGVTPELVLLTHHHHDHVEALAEVRREWPRAPVLISPIERDLVEAATGTIDAGERLAIGELAVRPLLTPGHTAGMLSFLVAARRRGRRLHR